MKKKSKIKKAERDEIFILLQKRYSIRSISRALGRSPNSVSYEIRNNSTNGKYNPEKADKKARVSLQNRRFQWRKINQDKELRKYIVTGLKDHWNPDEISGRMKKEKKPFYTSKTAIYEWLRTARGNRYCEYLRSSKNRSCYIAIFRLRFGYSIRPNLSAPIVSDVPVDDEGCVLFYGLQNGELSLYALQPKGIDKEEFFNKKGFFSSKIPFKKIYY